MVDFIATIITAICVGGFLGLAIYTGLELLDWMFGH
jgi:hypothetical protein